MKRKPWPDKYIEQKMPSECNARDFMKVLADARDEAPLQTYLAAVPSILRRLLPSAADAWCFDRPILGGELIPDFLLAYENSTGINWAYVELESPCVSPLNKAGRVSAKLNDALGQVRDWRIWLRNNISYAQSHLGYYSIDAECRAFIIIGRRSMIEAKHSLKYRELSKNKITVMSYDRLFDSCLA